MQNFEEDEFERTSELQNVHKLLCQKTAFALFALKDECKDTNGILLLQLTLAKIFLMSKIEAPKFERLGSAAIANI